MTTIHKSSDVPFSAEQMYALVNDIEAYPEFLPWCSEATIFQEGTHSLTATVSLQSGKIKQAFTTDNIMQPGSSIEVKLVKGPFKHLSGIWHFKDLTESQCRITLDMSFEFNNRIIKMALNKIFSKIVNSLVDAFTKRAQQLYGE